MIQAKANMLARKFHICSDHVKISLLVYRTLHTAPFWTNFKKTSVQRLQVAWNDCMRILLKKPR